MEIKQLQCFIAVAEELNFTSAAERMYISQPSLSRHIHNLEEELGLILFTRDKKTVELTNAGLQLLTNAREVVGSAAELQNTARELSSGRAGKLRIGYQGSACSIVPTILYRFSHKYPNINVTVEEYGARELMQKLSGGELDMVIAFSIAAEITEETDGFRHCHLMNDELALFLGPKKYEAYKTKAIEEYRRLYLKDFENEKMIMISREVNPGYYDYLQRIYMDHSFLAAYPDRQPTLLSTLMLLVKSNLGVAFLPKAATLDAHPGCPYIDLADVHDRLSIEAIWSESNYNPSLFLLTELLDRQDNKTPSSD